MVQTLTGQRSVSATIELLLAEIRNPNTRRAYEGDYKYFFNGDLSSQTVDAWLTAPEDIINTRLHELKARMIQENLSPATSNRRLASIRKLVDLARSTGLTKAQVDVKNERTQDFRNTAGFGTDVLDQLIALTDKTTVKGLRDRAIMELLWENALRRSEVTGLMVADFVPLSLCVWIFGKGTNGEKNRIEISQDCATTITAYLEKSGHGNFKDNPLFVNLHHGNHTYEALRPDGIYFMLAEYGKQLGHTIRPHLFRHGSITEVLRLTGGDLVAAQEHARHRDPRTTLKYNFNRGRGAKKATELLKGRFK